MSITQTVDIPARGTAEPVADTQHHSRAEAVEYCAGLFKRLGINDIPVDDFLDKCCEGRGLDALLDLMQEAEEQGECPVCAAYRDPITGEERFNAETIAAIREGRAMMRGEIPCKTYDSPEEMWADLMRDDDED